MMKNNEKTKGLTYGELCKILEEKTGKYWGICSIDLNDGNGTKEIGFCFSNNPFPNKNYKTIRKRELEKICKQQYDIDIYGGNCHEGI